MADHDWHLKNRMVAFATAWKGAVVDPFRLQVGARGLVEHLEHNLYELVKALLRSRPPASVALLVSALLALP